MASKARGAADTAVASAAARMPSDSELLDALGALRSAGEAHQLAEVQARNLRLQCEIAELREQLEQRKLREEITSLRERVRGRSPSNQAMAAASYARAGCPPGFATPRSLPPPPPSGARLTPRRAGGAGPTVLRLAPPPPNAAGMLAF
mmetsp:Transcript_53120/g.147833  ORF Transcript_53120/g.147833 Transcript_53120/m.147833 type:complete len:148 (-) Transcript_53120:79-522(-)